MTNTEFNVSHQITSFIWKNEIFIPSIIGAIKLRNGSNIGTKWRVADNYNLNFKMKHRCGKVN